MASQKPSGTIQRLIQPKVVLPSKTKNKIAMNLIPKVLIKKLYIPWIDSYGEMGETRIKKKSQKFFG